MGLQTLKHPMVGYINMQKSLVEIGGLGNKSMSKIVTLSENNSNIVPSPGPRTWGQYSTGVGHRGRGLYLSSSP